MKPLAKSTISSILSIAPQLIEMNLYTFKVQSFYHSVIIFIVSRWNCFRTDVYFGKFGYFSAKKEFVLPCFITNESFLKVLWYVWCVFTLYCLFIFSKISLLSILTVLLHSYPWSQNKISLAWNPLIQMESILNFPILYIAIWSIIFNTKDLATIAVSCHGTVSMTYLFCTTFLLHVFIHQMSAPSFFESLLS